MDVGTKCIVEIGIATATTTQVPIRHVTSLAEDR